MNKVISLLFHREDANDVDSPFVQAEEMLISLLYFIIRRLDIRFENNNADQGLYFVHIMRCQDAITDDNWDPSLIADEINKICQQEYGSALLDFIHVEKTPNKDKGWKKLSQEVQYEEGNIFLNLSTAKEIEQFELRLKPVLKRRGRTIFIESYFDCSSVLANIDFNHENHIFMMENAELFYNELVKKSHGDRILTTTSVIKSKPNASNKLLSFDVKNKITSIFYSKNSKLEIDDKYRALQSWAGTFLMRPSCFFSYCNRDSYNHVMREINIAVNKYFPFLYFQKDTEIKHAFKSINEYTERLSKGDFVIILIGEQFLKSLYPMKELLHLLEREDAFKEGVDVDNCINRLSARGCFILVDREGINDLVYESNNYLEDFWKNQNEYSGGDVDYIMSHIKLAKSFISGVNSTKSIKNHSEEGYKTLIMHINSALQEREDYYDINKQNLISIN